MPSVSMFLLKTPASEGRLFKTVADLSVPPDFSVTLKILFHWMSAAISQSIFMIFI